MKLSDFRFSLTPDLISQYPAKKRDEAKLMVLHRKTQTIEHKLFKDIIDYFDDGDVMVVNNTKIFPARIYGTKEKTGAKIEVFLLRELNKETKLWDVLVDPARKIRIGNKLYFGDNDQLVAEVIDNTTSRGRTLRFLYDGPHQEFKNIIYGQGETPLPKLIKRPVEPEDADRYQTIFAKKEGGVATPTAGLHFSIELMKLMKIKGINFSEITLHTGLGNFRAIEVEDLSKHKTDSEEINVDESTVEIVNEAKNNKKKICAIGTTSLKTLESCVTISGHLKSYSGWTNKFIFSPYDFRLANALVTNFHLPQSSMMIATAAFAGEEFLHKAYKEAIAQKYGFFTYGDAMLIL
ncbi:MAG: tRNA preQ1(34) S-adenosylmethionine ribosyltransferase-isomerase QueA [Bacteroidales bacterium]|nr:tRNA preQ1(34) S-adenosylmethionine ribosyltransferase-isomerase QueA [Bacteroidales bacterium]